MIEAFGLSRRFGDVKAVDEVSFDARRGEILGVLGPNGAGKTTTLRILAGYLPPDAGTALVGGIDVVREPLEARRKLGYLPEGNPLYPEMRVVDYLAYRAGLKGVARAKRRARIEEVVERCGLGPERRRGIGTLSKGYRQRVGIADALIGDPEALILDEPTVGLDPLQVLEVRALIRDLREERTVLVSSHVLPEVESIADRVVIFRRGRVVAIDRPEVLRERIGGAASVTLELRADALGALEGKLAAIDPAPRFEPLEEGYVRVELDAADDPREELFRAAAEAGVTLRELTRARLSLEEIFRQLAGDDTTMSEPAASNALAEGGRGPEEEGR